MLLLTIIMGLSVSVWAAEDAAGTWKATMQGPNGAQESTFVLKSEGGKVTGSITAMMGTVQITDGKLDGDKISFSISTDFGVMKYSGTIAGDDMKLTLSAGDGQFTLDFVAHRAKA